MTTPALIAELIPTSFFQEMQPQFWLWLIAAGGIALLVVGADRAVTAAVHLARAAGMSTVLIGATVVSLGTTTPEAVVSVRAALLGEPGLALGNAVGSIICDTALIFGLCCVIRPLPMNRFVLNRHGWLQLGSGLLLTLTALAMWWRSGDLDQVWLPRWVGVFFLVLLAAYLAVSVRWARQHPELIPDEAVVGPQPKVQRTAWQIIAPLLSLVVGLALVVGGSEVLIGSVKEISLRNGVPEAVLAVTLVAFGTSLPELVTALMSLYKGHPELLVGNIIGADILNVLFVTGASAAAVPLRVTPEFFYLFLPVMMLVLILLRVYIFINRETFRRWQGVPLLAIYGAFLAILVLFFRTPGV